MLQHRSMIELSREYSFFIPMCVVIGREKVKDAIWGASFRMYLGAVLAMLDLVTDLLAIYAFFEENRLAFAWANTAFVGMSLFFQLVLVFEQNRKAGMKVVANESMYVLLMIKPAIDASRVAHGNVHQENRIVNPTVEIVSSRR